MIQNDRKYSILSLIFRTLGLVAVVISLFLFIYDIRIVYKGILLGICSIPLFSGILSLIFEHLSEVKIDKVYKIGLMIFDFVFIFFGIFSLFYSIIYMF